MTSPGADDTIWVASCANDLICQLDTDGGLLHFVNVRDQAEACRALGWQPPRLQGAQAIRKGAIDFRDPPARTGPRSATAPTSTAFASCPTATCWSCSASSGRGAGRPSCR